MVAGWADGMGGWHEASHSDIINAGHACMGGCAFKTKATNPTSSLRNLQLLVADMIHKFIWSTRLYYVGSNGPGLKQLCKM